MEERLTFCRICESLCGLVATVEDGRVTKLRPDREHPLEGEGGRAAGFPLRLIGLRELRSHNSWMHNSPLLMRDGRDPALRIHPADATTCGVEDGGRARIASKSGEVETSVRVSDEVRPGTVALPHGWGHRGGWSRANAAGGPNVNRLASSEVEDLEPLAGMAHLNGIPVRVGAATPAAS